MPQMKPMMWTLLMLITLLSLMITMISLYFIYYNKKKISNLKIHNYNKWKWMW